MKQQTPQRRVLAPKLPNKITTPKYKNKNIKNTKNSNQKNKQKLIQNENYNNTKENLNAVPQLDLINDEGETQ